MYVCNIRRLSTVCGIRCYVKKFVFRTLTYCLWVLGDFRESFTLQQGREGREVGWWEEVRVNRWRECGEGGKGIREEKRGRTE